MGSFDAELVHPGAEINVRANARQVVILLNLPSKVLVLIVLCHVRFWPKAAVHKVRLFDRLVVSNSLESVTWMLNVS
jgi:hypothetical protein